MIFKMRWALDRSLAVGLTAIFIVHAFDAHAQSDEDVQKQLSNPIASLTVVPIQSLYDFNIGPDRAGTRVTTNIQPVTPFKLNDDLSLVVRTIVPVVGQNNIAPGAGSQFGLGDSLQSFFFVPKTVNGFTWGAGPALQYRTGTDPLLTSGKWGAGPTFVVIQETGPWTLGLLTNHLWSYAGDFGRSSVSNTYVQPFVAYAASGGWTYSLNTQSTYDWTTRRWSVPLLAQISKLTKIGEQPVSLATGIRYWAASPITGAHGLAGLVSVSFIFK